MVHQIYVRKPSLFTYLASEFCDPDRLLELGVPLLDVGDHILSTCTVVVNGDTINLIGRHQ